MTTTGSDTTYPGGAGATGAITQLVRPARSNAPAATATIHRFRDFILGSPMNASANPRPQRTVARLTEGDEAGGLPSHSTAFSDRGPCTRRGQSPGDTPVRDEGRGPRICRPLEHISCQWHRLSPQARPIGRLGR